jgi:hypothetical protein
MTERERDMEYLRAYYACHNADPHFRKELEQLVTQLSPPDQAAPPPKAAADRAVKFVDSWKLPPGEGRLDLLYSVSRLHEARNRPGFRRPPKLVLRPRAIRTRVDVENRYGVTTLELEDPDAFAEARLRRTLAPRHAARAAEAARTQLGLNRLPPRHRATGEIERIAERLYRRAVLRWSWERISEAEADGNGPSASMCRYRVSPPAAHAQIGRFSPEQFRVVACPFFSLPLP